MNKTKRLIILVISLTLVLAICGATLYFVFHRGPDVEEIYDRVVELVEASHELNTVFYGAGLPVYKTDSVYADITYMYYDFQNKGYYEYVSDHAKFLFTQDIKQAAEQVYSTAYLNDILYNNAFVGYAIEDGEGGAAYAHARFLEDENWIYQSTYAKSYLEGMRIYDYSTMKVVAPSTSKACYVTMDSWIDTAPDQITTVRLRLVLQDDGLWYLDSFTG